MPLVVVEVYEVPTQVALGYPGEVQNGPGARLQWWAFAMIRLDIVTHSMIFVT